MLSVLLMCLLPFALQSCYNEPFCTSCATYNDRNYCAKCSFSIYDEQKKLCRPPCSPIHNCAEYYPNNAAKCLYCDFGFGLNAQSHCDRCNVKDCAICNGDVNSCQSCFDGRVPVNNECVKDERTGCLDSNCNICNTEGDLCYRCTHHYALDSSMQCARGPSNCNIIDEADGMCKVCNYGFYISNDKECLMNASLARFDIAMITISVVFVIVLVGALIYWRWVWKDNSLRQSLSTEGDYYLPVY